MAKMTIAEYQEKLERAQQKKARAEGAQQSLLERWKTDYGLNSAKEVKAKIAELEESIESDQETLSNLFKELDEAVDWEEL